MGRQRGGHAWHGHAFKAALRTAMAEGYGITGVRPRNVFHGAYAEALEARRLRSGAQLELPLAV